MAKRVGDLEAKNKELRESLAAKDELIAKLQVRQALPCTLKLGGY